MAQLTTVVIGLIFLLVGVILRWRWQRQPVSNKRDLYTQEMASPDHYHDSAAHYMHREHPDGTSQATALLNEACRQPVPKEKRDWQNRAQSLGAAARLIRETMVDHARGRCAGKSGGLVEKLPLDRADAFSREPAARQRIANEIGDVGIALLLLCERTGIDPMAAMRDKLLRNRERYPVELAKGRAARPVG